MLLANTIWFARTAQDAHKVLQGIGLEPDDPPVIAITPLIPEQCLARLAPMSHAVFDFGLLPDPDHPPSFVKTLAEALKGSCMLESVQPGVVEAFIHAQMTSAPETLVVYGTEFDPAVLPFGMPTINLLAVDRQAFAGRPSRELLELWQRSTLIVPFDRLDAFAERMAASRLSKTPSS